MYTQTKLLYSCVKEDNNILAEYIEHCGDKLLEDFILAPAKGGNWAKDRLAEGKTVRALHDQNMLSHINNGLYPTHELISILEEKNIIKLSEQEKKIYTIAYTTHDVDKIWHTEIKSNNKEEVDNFKNKLLSYCKDMNMDKFFPELEENIGNIAFLLLNTQVSWGANLDDFHFNVTLNGKKLTYLRHLCTYSDKIAYLLKSPSDILNNGKSINELLETLSNQQLKFFFHKVPDVRGLLTNVINNSIMKIYKENYFIPYLFFPDGIVYLGDFNSENLKIETDILFDKLKNNLSKICSDKIKKNPPGFKFTNLSTTKNPEYYFDFLNVSEYMDVVMTKAINPTGADPSKSMVQHFRKLPDLDISQYLYEPDERIGGIGRYLIFLDDNISTIIDKKDDLYKLIFKHLNIEEYMEPFLKLRQSIENFGGLGKVSGGTKIEWFYIGSKFLDKHKGLSFDSEEETSIKTFLSKLNNEIFEKYEDILNQSPNFKGIYLDSLYKYLENFNFSQSQNIFSEELNRYTNSKKSKKPETVCTICNSSYPISTQDESSVPFQASVFKNKLALHKSSSAGGICNICSLEFMLRQILIKGVKLTGSGFSDMKPKYFFVYPNYFFTNSTQKFVRKIFEHSKNINIFKIKQNFESSLKQNNLSVKSFLDSEENLLDIDLVEKDSSFLKMEL